MTSAITAAITFFSISAFVFSACLIQAALQQSSSDNAEQLVQVKEENDEDENNGVLSRNFYAHCLTKNAPGSGAEEPSSSLTTLRRRRSVSSLHIIPRVI